MDDRYLKTTAFDAVPGGYAYYKNAWSKGIPVSAEERELYLSRAHVDWLRAIVGRKAGFPRRPYWPQLGRTLIAVLSRRDPGAR